MNFSIGDGRLPGATQASPAAAQHTRLVKAAQQFEAMLMQEMLKPMRTKDQLFADPAEDGKSGSDSDEDGGVLQGFATQAMAEGMAKSGGMGIAKQVVRQVEREHAALNPPRTQGGEQGREVEYPVQSAVCQPGTGKAANPLKVSEGNVGT